jgi:hypothetical protein
MIARLSTAAFVALLLLAAAPLSRAQDTPDLPAVQLNAEHNAGRPVEELTKKSVARDYALAWRTMAEALSSNRAGIIENDFVGVAQEKLASAVEQQAKSNLRRRYVDRGHKVEIVFYAPDGLSIQLRDTAQLELQVLDGDKVIHSEPVTAKYISLMSPTETRWKVRVLQAITE